MRNYFFIVTRRDSTKFVVTKKCNPTEVNAISASLASDNFACAYYCLEDYEDSEMFMRAILQEFNSVDITDYDTYMKKVREEEKLSEKFYDKVFNIVFGEGEEAPILPDPRFMDLGVEIRVKGFELRKEYVQPVELREAFLCGLMTSAEFAKH